MLVSKKVNLGWVACHFVKPTNKIGSTGTSACNVVARVLDGQYFQQENVKNSHSHDDIVKLQPTAKCMEANRCKAKKLMCFAFDGSVPLGRPRDDSQHQ